MSEESQFWADQLAADIISRKETKYTAKPVASPAVFTVKTSASLSGVLHLGRLSDTIRGDTLRNALSDAGVKARLIWVAEDTDPLRKIPEGVPDSFSKFLGMPVTQVPDPLGRAGNYADGFKKDYFEVIDQFVSEPMERFSMADEYAKGSFTQEIQALMQSMAQVREILGRYQDNLAPDWTPWVPVCQNCGKVATPKVLSVSKDAVEYVCEDYRFESTIATGCGHKGTAVPGKDPGKLRWKSEWAAQWKHWQISAEGAGKEYIVPNSAFWVNAEISERVLDYPSPVPMFYEHLMIDNEKMSASKGNVIYPSDWLKVASSDLLRFFYNKRLMKTRSFSWKDLAVLYDDFDAVRKAAAQAEAQSHDARLVALSVMEYSYVPPFTFSHAALVGQLAEDDAGRAAILEKTGHFDDANRDAILDRVAKAQAWVQLHAPDQKLELQESADGVLLTDQQRQALLLLADALGRQDWDEEGIFAECYHIIREQVKMQPGDFFKAAYQVLLRKDRGPRLAPFLLAVGREKAAAILSTANKQ
ncbi:lysine--tRNA ligase [Candidatus Woesearchaeota archaeon CG1_02_57_44]|nr:MAG: lysine--tRNA ligase [Candidatus Woesearchaeota archaeon CG1_02_57_44]